MGNKEKEGFSMKNVRNCTGTQSWRLCAIALAAVIGFTFAALSLTGCDNGTSGSVPPEELSEPDRWGKWVDDTSTATLDFSVDNDGKCTITVGGIAQPNDETDGWGRWKANAQYSYTARANTRYKYEFEAWTASDTRTVGVQYYGNNADEVYLVGSIAITTEPKTYTAYGQKIPKGGVRLLEFTCADQLGTFYVKNIRISTYETGELTITNFKGNPGIAADSWVLGDAELPNYDYLSFCSSVWLPNSYYIYPVEVTGSSLTLAVYNDVFDEEEGWKTTPFTGNVTVAAGKLVFSVYDRNGGGSYTNKVPITFTKGNAAINFGSQMEEEEEGELEQPALPGEALPGEDW